MLSRGTRTTQVAGRLGLAIDRYACASRAGVQVGRITQKRWASNKGSDSERPFYLQLQESIQERVHKEKAEQLAIQQMQQRTARGQFWATVTGECPRLESGITITASHDMLTRGSSCPRRQPGLLLWPVQGAQAQHGLDRAATHLPTR
jgi:uncharacterized protein YdbL (DUF1318 family)